jgi:hypothetical protein
MFTILIGLSEICLPSVSSLEYGSFWKTDLVPLYSTRGRAVAQTVSRWLPTAAARIRVRSIYGVCGGQRGIGASFLRVLRLPIAIIPPISPSYSPGADTIGLLVAAVPSGPNWTPPSPPLYQFKKFIFH